MARTATRAPLLPRLLFLGALVLLGAIAWLRPTARLLRGDEGTYVAMATSLARDLDLAFDEADLERARALPEGPSPLILQRAGGRLTYSKPILYPLLAAPFVRLAGAWGPALVNLIALGVGAALARAALARRFGAAEATWIAATFLGAGAASVWLGWRMPEALQLGLALAGAALAWAPLRPAPCAGEAGRLERWLASPRAALAGGLLLGLLASLREPNALLALAAVGAALAARRRRDAVRIAAGALAGYGAIVLLAWGLTGAPNAYKAPRATFSAETGWPVGAGAEAALARFTDTDELATSSLGAFPRLEPARSAYAALYFFAGRHTGLLVYFPGALALVAAALASYRSAGDRVGLAALGGVAAVAVYYLVWLPANYFGGETFVGNRYVLAALPLALTALAAPPPRRLLAAAWALAFACGSSALVSVVRTRAVDATSQSHASAGLFRLLPYESTASNIDGRRDRYWSGDFVRFVDPYARADAWSFRLEAGEHPAEIEVATAWPGDPLRLLVTTDVERATLVVSDWWGTRRHPLAEHAEGPAGGVVALRPAPAWRVHPFWWSRERLYRARLLRLALETPEGRPAQARLRYLGRHEPPRAGFGREVLGASLPTSAPAGGSSLIPLRLKNGSTFAWTSEAVLPVALGFRFGPEQGAGLAAEGRTLLPRRVEPGEELATALRVDWPSVPGRYRLTVDLVLEDVAWFAERVGAPIGETIVEVRRPDA